MNAIAPSITLVDLARWANGDLVVRRVPEGATAREAFLSSGVTGASIDTRAIEPGMLFVPLPGSRVDGHAFLDEAFARGAAAALCARDVHARIAHLDLGPLVVVEDVTAALQQLARRFREKWTGLLVGVTGSSGKTTTKDLVATVLETAAPSLRTRGNLNNHWGVPLTLLALRPEHGSAVVEMGMSHAGEIAALAALAGPGAAVVTNAGSAHLEGLGSLEAIAAEKAALVHALPAGAPAFVGADSPRLVAAVAGARAKVVTFGLADGADVHPDRVEDLGPEGSRVHVDGFPPIRLRLVGTHQVRNALAAIAVAREWRLDPAAVAAALEGFAPLPGRMEVLRAGGAFILKDCYNANPESTRAALETLAGWPGASRRIALLGDMLELGAGAAELHRGIGSEVRDAELWTVGAHAGDYAGGARAAGRQARVFADRAEAAAALREALGPGVVVLIKGSRGAALEQVLEGIEGER